MSTVLAQFVGGIDMNLRTMKRVCFFMIGIFAILMLAMGITKNSILGYMAIAVVIIYGITHCIFWRCPKCEKNIGPLWVKHCPNCGEKIS